MSITAALRSTLTQRPSGTFAFATLCLLVLAALVGTSAPVARAASVPTPESGVAGLNALRAQAGLRAVGYDAARSDGCRRHAAYYAATGAVGHFEDPASPAFDALGDEAARTSNLAYGGEPFAGASDFTDAVYHRMAMLNPRLKTSGYWAANGIACLAVQPATAGPGVTALTPYPYPFAGQQHVPLNFECNEVPDPCAAVPGHRHRRPVGTIPSLQFDAPHDSIESTAVETATMTRVSTGVQQPLTVRDGGSGDAEHLAGGAIFIPHSVLAAGATYEMHVTGAVTMSDRGTEAAISESFETTWRFTTIGAPVRAAAAAPVKRRCTKRAKHAKQRRCQTAGGRPAR